MVRIAILSGCYSFRTWRHLLLTKLYSLLDYLVSSVDMVCWDWFIQWFTKSFTRLAGILWQFNLTLSVHNLYKRNLFSPCQWVCNGEVILKKCNLPWREFKKVTKVVTPLRATQQQKEGGGMVSIEFCKCFLKITSALSPNFFFNFDAAKNTREKYRRQLDLVLNSNNKTAAGRVSQYRHSFHTHLQLVCNFF